MQSRTAALVGDGAFTAQVAALAESLFETDVAVDVEDELLAAARQNPS